jgi:hypothetical protein
MEDKTYCFVTDYVGKLILEKDAEVMYEGKPFKLGYKVDEIEFVISTEGEHFENILKELNKFKGSKGIVAIHLPIKTNSNKPEDIIIISKTMIESYGFKQEQRHKRDDYDYFERMRDQYSDYIKYYDSGEIEIGSVGGMCCGNNILFKGIINLQSKLDRLIKKL